VNRCQVRSSFTGFVRQNEQFNQLVTPVLIVGSAADQLRTSAVATSGANGNGKLGFGAPVRYRTCDILSQCISLQREGEADETDVNRFRMVMVPLVINSSRAMLTTSRMVILECESLDGFPVR
jgi:hypothetical protein